MRTGSPEATSESWPQLQEAVRLFMGMCTLFLPPPNAAHQRHGKVARILRFAKCVTLSLI